MSSVVSHIIHKVLAIAYSAKDGEESMKLTSSVIFLFCIICLTNSAGAAEELPVADVHVHYSHDSVDLTPPERVIELMRQAKLKFALVSSSDDRGTQLLLQQAPELIIPGLRPYRRRGELNNWFKDPDALAYVEGLLQKNRYATIGEFHLYGSDAELEIPQRLVQLADQHNLILHAHSDAGAVERLLASSDTVRVLWAHAGFDSPATIAKMLRKHDRLWADLAFRFDIGSGGFLDEAWVDLFTEFPTRLMLGTDTYTPERIYFIPEHASSARDWLKNLPADLAERIAWKNAFELLMPIWQQNQSAKSDSQASICPGTLGNDELLLLGSTVTATLSPDVPLVVGQPFAVTIRVCSDHNVALQTVDAFMPAHGHGMNYEPEVSQLAGGAGETRYLAEGLLLHMPGTWQWSLKFDVNGQQETLEAEITL